MDNKENHFHFTVGKLIEILKTFPQDLPVLTSGYKDGYENFYYPEILDLKHEPDNMHFNGEFQFPNKGDKDTVEAIVLQRVVRDD